MWVPFTLEMGLGDGWAADRPLFYSMIVQQAI